MIKRGIPAPPPVGTLDSVCLAPELCDDVKTEEVQTQKQTAVPSDGIDQQEANDKHYRAGCAMN